MRKKRRSLLAACFVGSVLLFIRRWSALDELGENETNATRQACVLPRLPLKSPEINVFFKDADPLVCGDGLAWLTFSGNKAEFSAKARKLHGAYTCQIQAVYWFDDFNSRLGEWISITENAATQAEQMRVFCNATDGSVYKSYAFAVLPNEAKNTNKKKKEKKTDKDKRKLNVYMLAIDSVSRLTFMRKLPAVYAFLRDRLKAAVLEGYNIVGDGTPQALLPMLTGQTELELPNTRKGDRDAVFCDAYPWIWKEFEREGYVTTFMEDTPTIGTWQYRLKGFAHPPTTFYPRPLFVDKASRSGREFLGGYSDACNGPEPAHKFIFRHTENLFNSYKTKRPVFAFTLLGGLSHESVNKIQVAEADILAHLSNLVTSGVLNNSLLLLFADHGPRFSDFRATHQGQMEERLPFVSISAPDWWRRAHSRSWGNLLINQHRLATPFDLHPTLQALINRNESEQKSENTSRSQSLWEEIPATRTCRDADVEPHWCACLAWQPISTKSSLARDLALAVVARINAATQHARHLCLELRLADLMKARREVTNSAVLRYRGAADAHGFVADLSNTVHLAFAQYQLQIRTSPNDALYEATVVVDKQNRTKVDLEQISRINRYGDQPNCIKNEQETRLLNFCICSSAVK